MTVTLHSVRSGVSPHADLQPQMAGLFAGMFPAYSEGSSEVRQMIEDMVGVFNDREATDEERHAATDTLVEILFRQEKGFGIDLESAADICGPESTTIERTMDDEETVFSENLKHLMSSHKVTQAQLAEKTGVGQPAISMMLRRKCRPQRSTVEKFAKALGVEAKEVWPTK